MTSRYRGEKAVPFSLKGMGITPIVERSVVSGIDVPLLSFPAFTVSDKRIALPGLPYHILRIFLLSFLLRSFEAINYIPSFEWL